ncbi:hypothetical protein HPB47_026096 [Ixodes persulcatus]|uniref:Uncharacterized protein n=1 Tax=Ixodes persulcatus TaxID=34615 RepID=A0AC60Q0B6_IXOPE|nr:hypothetical protein HPB47_026096 [Ixodes persulcatus]
MSLALGSFTAEFRNLTQTTLTLKGPSTSSRKARGPALANRDGGSVLAIGLRRPSRLPRGSGAALKWVKYAMSMLISEAEDEDVGTFVHSPLDDLARKGMTAFAREILEALAIEESADDCVSVPSITVSKRERQFLQFGTAP